MYAIGQAGAYIAGKVFYITAFDITKEMIDERNKRFNSVENFTLKVADICNFNEKEFDFCFIAAQDY